MKKLKTEYKITGLLLTLVLLSFTILTSPSSSADNPSNVNFSVNVLSACSLVITGADNNNNLSFTTTVNPGEDAVIGSANVKAICNDPNGLAVYAVGYGNNTYGETNLVSTTDNTRYIPTATASSSSQWNMTLTPITGTYAPSIATGFDSAHAIPSTYTKVAYRNTNTDVNADGYTATGAGFTANFNLHASVEQTAGTYTGKVKFLLVHPNVTDSSTNPVTTLPDTLIGTMQDVAKWEHKVAQNQTVYAIDERDNEMYTVARLADGELWMTKNLRLDLSKYGDRINSSNTNNPDSAFVTAASSKPVSSSGSSWCTGNTSECVDAIHYNADLIGNNSQDSLGQTYDDYGIHYNWYTATAGRGTSSLTNSDATGDICPSGWHLPTGTIPNGNYSTWTGDYLKLTAAVAGISMEDFDSSQDLQNITNAQNTTTFLSAPYNFILTGSYSGSLSQNNSGGYWTSTAGNGTSTGYFSLSTTSSINPGITGPPKFIGYTVRCVANPKTMQTVPLWGSSVEQGETATAIDERDGEIYTVGRLADGKLWMMKNLRLDLATANITADNTNNPTSSFLTTISNISSTSVADWCNGYETTECAELTLYNNSLLNDSTIDEDGRTYSEYGVYYNWKAATAGNDGASGDICPSNWRLPLGANSTQMQTGDYYNLVYALNNGNGQYIQYQNASLRVGPPYFLATSGDITVTGPATLTVGNLNHGGYLWTSTLYSSSNASVVSIQSNYIYSTSYSRPKYYGVPIRCLAD